MPTVSSQLSTLNSTYLASVNCALLGKQNTTASTDNGYRYGHLTSGSSVLDNGYQNTPDSSANTDSLGNATVQTTTAAFSLNGTTPKIYVFNTKQDNSSPEFTPYDIGSYSATTVGGNTLNGTFTYNALVATATDSVNFTNAANKLTTDINCMELFFTSRSGIISIPNAFFCLQALYAWYSLLDNFTWQTYSRAVPTGTTATPVDIYVPDIVTGTATNNIKFTKVTLNNNGTGFPTSTVGASGAGTGQLYSQNLAAGGTGSAGSLTKANATLGDLMNYYIPFNSLLNNNGPTANFNPFVARRIIHLHIMSFHWNLVTKYYNTATTQINPLINAVFSLLDTANTNVTDANNGVLKTITDGINERSGIYYSDQNTLNDLNSSSSAKPNSVPNLQTTINQNSNKLAVTLQYENTLKKYKTAGIAVLCVIIGSIGALFVLPIDAPKKMIYCGILIILAVATAFSLQYLLNKTLTTEGFALGQTTGTATSVSSISAYNTIYNDDVLTYLQNTFILTTTLDSYHLYGDASYALNNQVSYYTDAQTSLSTKSQNLKDVNNISYINQITASATINFCVAVSLILSISATLYFSFQNYPGLRSAIVYISALLIFIAIVIYVLEINNRVHTHPKQIYWGADTRAFSNSA
jgi:hypothetical protein